MSSPAIELFLRQKQRGVGQINSRTSAIRSALEPFAARAAGYYAPIQAQESALGASLAGSITAAGAQQGAQIGGALQGIQAPQQAVDTYGGGTATMGAQAGQAVGALSSADLERLHGQSSAEQIYASALPRLAQLAGEAERRNFMAQAQQELSDLALEEAQRQAEQAQADREWAYKVQQDRLDRQADLRDFRYERRQDRLARQRQARLDRMAQAAVRYETGQDALKNRQSQARINQGQARIDLAIRKQNESEAEFQQRERRYRQQFDARMAAARRKGFQPNSALSAKYGYIVDSHGKPILTPKGKKIHVRTDKTAASGKPDWNS